MTPGVEWTILLPLSGGCIAFVLSGNRRALGIIGAAIPAVTLAAAAAIARQIQIHGPQQHPVGGWDAPLGIVLRVDGLSALMVLMTSAVIFLVSLHAIFYFDGEEKPGWAERDGFWPLWFFLFGGLNALFVTSDIFNAYVLIELLSLAAVAMAALSGAAALADSMRYLLAVFMGSMLYLLGVALLYASFDTLDMMLLGERISEGAPAAAALTLILLGLMIKSALFPFHAWLPRAHAGAPSPVSAALSALVVMAAVYLFVRLWTQVFGPVPTPAAAQAVGALGVLGMVWGSLRALGEERLKLVVAYSTVAQVGYLFMVVPLVTAPAALDGEAIAPWRFAAWAGGMFHLLSHAFAKAALFLTAGTVLYALGDDRVDGLRGMARGMPVTFLTFGVAGTAMVGIPPTGGFIAKWLLITAAIESGQWWWAVAMAAGTFLTAGYVFRILREAFGRAETAAALRPVSPAVHAVGLTLALASLALGLRPGDALSLLEAGAPFPPMAED